MWYTYEININFLQTMEIDTQEFSKNPPTQKFDFHTFMKWFFIVIIVLSVVYILILVWEIKKAPHVAISTPISTDSIIVFPKTNSIRLLAVGDIPEDIRSFILNGATEVMANTLEYSGQKTGIQLTYEVSSSTPLKFLVKFQNEFLNSARNKPLWTLLSSKGENEGGYFEFESKTTLGEKVEIKYNRKNINDIEVTLQSIK